MVNSTHARAIFLWLVTAALLLLAVILTFQSRGTYPLAQIEGEMAGVPAECAADADCSLVPEGARNKCINGTCYLAADLSDFEDMCRSFGYDFYVVEGCSEDSDGVNADIKGGFYGKKKVAALCQPLVCWVGDEAFDASSPDCNDPDAYFTPIFNFGVVDTPGLTSLQDYCGARIGFGFSVQAGWGDSPSPTYIATTMWGSDNADPMMTRCDYFGNLCSEYKGVPKCGESAGGTTIGCNSGQTNPLQPGDPIPLRAGYAPGCQVVADYDSSGKFSPSDIACTTGSFTAAPNPCGNGAIDAGEECDDGDTINDNGCSNLCKLPICGDGIVQVGEGCDEGANNSNTEPDRCREDCTIERCGDGVVDTGEACDDGNTVDNDACRNDCTRSVSVCGNGVKEGAEQCDLGADNALSFSGCDTSCKCSGNTPVFYEILSQCVECLADSDCSPGPSQSAICDGTTCVYQCSAGQQCEDTCRLYDFDGNGELSGDELLACASRGVGQSCGDTLCFTDLQCITTAQTHCSTCTEESDVQQNPGCVCTDPMNPYCSAQWCTSSGPCGGNGTANMGACPSGGPYTGDCNDKCDGDNPPWDLSCYVLREGRRVKRGFSTADLICVDTLGSEDGTFVCKTNVASDFGGPGGTVGGTDGGDVGGIATAGGTTGGDDGGTTTGGDTGGTRGDTGGDTGDGGDTGTDTGGDTGVTGGDTGGGDTFFACRNSQCTQIEGFGNDSCKTDVDCEDDKHLECIDQACVVVQGAQQNTCSTNDDCQDEVHLECVNQACTEVPGAEENTCLSNDDCQDDIHLECVNQACTTVPGAEENTCSTNDDCQDDVHLECVNQACTEVPGAEGNTCTSDASCVDDTHLTCVNEQCTEMPGAADNTCQVDADCQDPCEANETCITASSCANESGIEGLACGGGRVCCFIPQMRTACVDFACVSVVGNGSNECLSDIDCLVFSSSSSITVSAVAFSSALPSTQDRFCGDGIINVNDGVTEECDNGLLNSDGIPNRCRTNCTLPRCGDGIVDSVNSEQCDDGNTESTDGCAANCQVELPEPFTTTSSSSSSSDSSEESSLVEIVRSSQATSAETPTLSIPSSQSSSSETITIEVESSVSSRSGQSISSSSSARRLVAAASICGNGALDQNEECDDSNRRNNDGCNAECQLEIGICGDGIVQSLLGEQCEQISHDPSLPYSCSRCRFVSQSCGDGTVDPGEECDEGQGNSTSPDANCRPDCSFSRCGDAVLDSAEFCDDGNRLNGDGCDRFCMIETSLPPSMVAAQTSSQAAAPTIMLNGMQFPFVPGTQTIPYQLPLAQLQPLVQGTAPVGDTGPAAVAVIGAGAAAGFSWMRRKKK